MEKPADFETAITATGLGKFNIILFFVGFPCYFSAWYVTTTMSYILPIAQCDLDLSLHNMGMLNAVTYIGMITSAFFWGYLIDTMGRKRLIIIGFLLDGIFAILCGLSPNFTMLLISKYLGGLVISGPYAAVISYMNEFHCAKYRAVLPPICGMISGFALISLPLLGWLVFSDSINIVVYNNYVLRSWNVFLLVCALPSLLASILFKLLPETPKFLMTMGNNDKALEVLQMIYSWNTGAPANEFPIKELLDETKLRENEVHLHGGHVTANRTKVQALKEGWQQITPLFFPPYLSKLLMVLAIQFSIMSCGNTMRLWLPKIFTAINDYKQLYPNDHDADLCTMIEMMKPTSDNNEQNTTECTVNYDNSSVYMNNIIIWIIYIIICVICTVLVGKIGKRNFLGIAIGVFGSTMYFAKTEIVVVILACGSTSFAVLSTVFMTSVVVDIFPTTLRTMAVSLTMMFGRIGAMLGNLTFSLLLSAGCFVPFLTFGFLGAELTILILLLPKTDKKPLQ